MLSDRNTLFFHLYVITRKEKKKNVIFSIFMDYIIIFKLAKVKQEVVMFYKGLYSLEKWYGPFCSKLKFHKILYS